MNKRFLIPRSRLRNAIGIAVLMSAAAAASLHQIMRRADRAALLLADPEVLLTDRRLSLIAMRRGRPVYLHACASCHGENGQGDRSRGAPDLTDQEHLYGQGHVAEIERIVLHGIRSGDTRGWHLSSMPAFARRPSEVEAGINPLSPAEVQDVTQYLLSLRQRQTDGDAAKRGRLIFTTRGACYDCHGEDAKGDTAIGGPNLGDDIWLHGDGSAASIAQSIEAGRAGVCPAFGNSMDAGDVRAVAAFVAAMPSQLGQGAMR